METVEQRTDPENPEWKQRCDAKDVGALADWRPPGGTITFKMLADRMIDHVRDNLNKDIFSGYDTIGVNTTVLKMMTMVLLTRVPKTLDAKGRPRPEPEIASARKDYVAKQVEICDFGAAELVIEVVACATDPQLVLQAVKLGIQLLDGGNKHVQGKMYAHLNSKSSDPFYQKCKMYIALEAKKIIDNRSLRAKDIEIADDPDRFGWHLMEFLRLWAEAHNLEMQLMLQFQENNKKEVNLLFEIVEFLVLVAKDAQVLRGMDEDELMMVHQALDFLVEALQGPCSENQTYLGEAGVITEICKRILTTKIFKPGHNQSLTVALVRAAVCALFNAMMEGPELPVVKNAISEKCDLELFKSFAMEIYKRGGELEIVIKGKDAAAATDAAAEFDAMLSCGFDLFCVYMQLATSDAELEKGISPNATTDMETQLGSPCSYFDAHKYLTSKIKRIEFMWCEPPQMDITYFPVCREATAMTEPSKDRLWTSVLIDTPDAKKRDFLARGQTMVDEMFYLYKLGKFPPFRMLNDSYTMLRQGAFGLVIVLNFLLACTITGPGNEGREVPDDDGDDVAYYNGAYDYNSIGVRPKIAMHFIRVLDIIIIVIYALCLTYCLVSRMPLIMRKRARDQEDIIELATKAAGGKRPPIPFGDWSLLKLYFAAIAFYGLFGAVLWVEYGDVVFIKGVEWWQFGVVMFGIWLVFLLKQFFERAVHPIAYWYCSVLNTALELKTLAILVFLGCMISGLNKFYYITLALLDLVTLSERLQNVIKAVAFPIVDLVCVFLLMIFVAFIFASFGLFFFGEFYQTNSDDSVFTGDVGADLRVNGSMGPGDRRVALYGLFGCFGGHDAAVCLFRRR